MSQKLKFSDEVIARCVQIFQEAILMNSDCTDLFRKMEMQASEQGVVSLDDDYVVRVKNEYAEKIAGTKKGLLFSLRYRVSCVARSSRSDWHYSSDHYASDDLLLLKREKMIEFLPIFTTGIFMLANVVHLFFDDRKNQKLASAISYAVSSALFAGNAVYFFFATDGHTSNVLTLCFSAFAFVCAYMTKYYWRAEK